MIQKNHVMSLGEADIYFLQNGATSFYDSTFPKSEWFDKPRIYQRYYFGKDDQYLGFFCPALWQMGTHVSLKHITDQRRYLENHPRLTRLLRELL